jgi:hypothetical protein
MKFFMEPDGALRHLTTRCLFLGCPCFMVQAAIEIYAAHHGTMYNIS